IHVSFVTIPLPSRPTLFPYTTLFRSEAILDAQTGEFERLKEFGIRAKDAGDSVIFTYKGVQTQVEKTSGSIREYITSLGDAQGRSEEHTSELQSRENIVCRLLLEKKK